MVARKESDFKSEFITITCCKWTLWVWELLTYGQDMLLKSVRENGFHIEKKDKKMRHTITAEQHLMVILHYLATANTF